MNKIIDIISCLFVSWEQSKQAENCFVFFIILNNNLFIYYSIYHYNLFNYYKY